MNISKVIICYDGSETVFTEQNWVVYSSKAEYISKFPDHTLFFSQHLYYSINLWKSSLPYQLVCYITVRACIYREYFKLNMLRLIWTKIDWLCVFPAFWSIQKNHLCWDCLEAVFHCPDSATFIKLFLNMRKYEVYFYNLILTCKQHCKE
jgi:hypothetical protein